MPDLRALMFDQSPPAWLDRMTFATDCGPTDALGVHANDAVLPAVARTFSGLDLARLDDPRNSSLYLLFGWGSLGPLPTAGTWMAYEPREFAMDPGKVKRVLDQFRGVNSMGKVALYDWNNSFDPRNAPFDRHPEWAARDIDGKAQFSFFHGVADFWPEVDARPNYLHPGYRDFMLGRYAELAREYRVDFAYIDADIGYGYADWATRTIPASCPKS